jgi:RNA polymerase sigma-70 factor (ECF subfamily)
VSPIISHLHQPPTRGAAATWQIAAAANHAPTACAVSDRRNRRIRDRPRTPTGRDAREDGEPSPGLAPTSPAPVDTDAEADDRFIETLCAQYSAVLLSAVLRMTGGDRHWAEDVVQETLLRAWRHADALRVGGESRSLMPWLATVARRIVLNDRRGRGVRPHEVDEASITSVGVPDDTERTLQRMVIDEALRRLTPAHRSVVVEMYLHGHSVQEVARILGIPAGTVKSRLHHAMRAMRAAFERRGITR